MQQRYYKFIFVMFALFFSACEGDVKRKGDPVPVTASDSSSSPSTTKIAAGQPVKYARRFSIRYHKNFTAIYLFGNRNNNDTTSTFVLYDDSLAPENLPKSTYILKTPCKKIAALSSIYATAFTELGMVDRIVAIDNIDYVNNRQIISRFKAGNIRELAKMPQVDIEQTVVLHPDIVFTFGMGDGKDRDEKFEQTKIPVAISVDHLEESPLARAEWIKFFAAFVNKKEMADAIFDSVEKNYFELQELAKAAKTKPTVFSEIKFGDTWYIPGGKSYVAQLLNDAGAIYLWKDDPKFGSQPLSFEQVYAKAKNADYWINLSTVKTKKELLGFESRYAGFKAFQSGNLYNNTRVVNSRGYTSYWETGMIFPNRILHDLILIFHPEVKAALKNDFYYYEQLK